jgi:hypothetical protein
MANGNYLYQLEPTFRSRVGVRHRGPLSPVLEVTAAANGSVTVKIGDASIDCKQDNSTGYASNSALNVEFPLFRSEANESVLYQLTMEPRYNRIPNDPCAAYLNFTDVSPDSTIAAFYPAVDIPTVPNLPLASRPQPYTASGELEDCQPPAQYTMLFYAGRLFLVTGGRREIWFSKDIKENGSNIAPGFNPEMVEVYDQDITALAALDDKRIIFWARGIWYVVGDGPTVAGTDNRFSTPQAIQSAVGCTNPRSVVTVPPGVIFQCGTDLYLLTRALEIEWIGRDARETLAAFPNITSAVLVARDGEVRFTCNNSGNTSGIILVFDYRRNTWSTRTYPESVSIQDAVVYNGTYFFATTAGLRFENPNIHLDDSVTFVDSTVELEPITPAGVPISWSRVRIAKLLGESLSNHRLDVSFSRDWTDTYEQTETFPAGSAPTTPGAHARAEILLTVQRREAVGIKFVDSAPANTAAYPLGNGAGFQFEGVGLLVIPKQGLPRDTSDRRGG